MADHSHSATSRQGAPGAQGLQGIEAFMRKRIVVISAALAAAVIAAIGAWFAIAAMSRESAQINLLPIRAVTFAPAAGEFARVDANELKHIAGAIQNMGGSMLKTDLNQVKAAVKQVEWVRDAEVRRRFPATLDVIVEEHAPFARWQVTADSEQSFLVNTFGEVFEAEFDGTLPVFSGPADSAREMMEKFLAFQTQLAAIQLSAAEVRLSARRAWQLKLANGSTLELGRSDADVRLARFVRAYPNIATLQLANARVDMRYQAGLAVRGASRASASASPMTAKAAVAARPATRKAAKKS